MDDFIGQLAKSAAGDGSPFSSALPNAGGKPAAPKPVTAAPAAAPKPAAGIGRALGSAAGGYRGSPAPAGTVPPSPALARGSKLLGPAPPPSPYQTMEYTHGVTPPAQPKTMEYVPGRDDGGGVQLLGGAGQPGQNPARPALGALFSGQPKPTVEFPVARSTDAPPEVEFPVARTTDAPAQPQFLGGQQTAQPTVAPPGARSRGTRPRVSAPPQSPTPPAAPAAPPAPAPAAPPAAPAPAPPAPAQPAQPAGGGPDMSKFLEMMAPSMMKHLAPSMGAVGGIPLLMMIWDLIGGSHGKNLKTIFGGRGQGADVGSDLGSAAGAAPGAPPAGEGAGAAPPGGAPGAPAVPGAAPGGPAGAPGGAPAGGAGGAVGPMQAEYNKAQANGPAAPAGDTGAALGQGAAAPAANPNWGEFGKLTSVGKGHADFEKMRERLAAEDGVTPDKISDDDVAANYYANAKARYGQSVGKADLSDDDFMAAMRQQPAAGAPPADTNWMQDFRRSFRNSTNTGTVRVPGTDVNIDPGRVATDGVAPQLGVMAGAKMLGTKAPGMLPVTFALDGLDQFGINPFTDRFGKGVLGHQELTENAKAHADMPTWLNVLTSLGKPISTIREGQSSTAQATGEMSSAIAGSWNADEKWRTWAAGQRTKFQNEANSPDQAVAANARARLAQIEAGMKMREGSGVQNMYINATKNEVAKPSDVLTGNFHMPWSDLNNDRTVGQAIGDTAKKLNPLNWFGGDD